MLNARPITQSSTKELISRSGHRLCGDVTDNTCITGLVYMYMYAVGSCWGGSGSITPLPLVVNGHFRFTVFNLKIVFCRTLIIYRVNVYFNNLLTYDRVPVRPLSFLYMYTLTRWNAVFNNSSYCQLAFPILVNYLLAQVPYENTDFDSVNIYFNYFISDWVPAFLMCTFSGSWRCRSSGAPFVVDGNIWCIYNCLLH